MTVRQRAAAGVIAAALTFSLAPAARADLPCLFGACGFSVSGKKGPCVKTVDAAKLEDLRKIVTGEGKDKGLTERALNRGELAGYGLHMPKTEAKLTAMLDDLTKAAAQWPTLTPLPPTPMIRIVAASSYAPQAQPDGVIVIPIGVLMRAKSKDEVAWLLAHEYAHILLAHFARDAAAVRKKQAIDAVTEAIATALDVSRVRANTTGQTVRLYAIDDPVALHHERRAESLQQQVRLVIRLHSQGVSRVQEDWADAAGVDLAMAAGYDAEGGAHDALVQIASDDERAAKLSQSFGDQVMQIAAQSVTQKSLAEANQQNFGAALSDVATNFRKNLEVSVLNQVINMLMSSHRSTEQRLAGVRAYVRDAYPGVDRDKSDAFITEIQNTDEYKQAIAALSAVDAAHDLIQADKAKEALAALEPSQSTRYARAPFVANTAGRIYDLLGDVHRADQAFDQSEAPQSKRNSADGNGASHVAGATGRRGSKARSARTAVAAAPPEPPTPDDPFMRQSLTGYTDHIRLLTAHQKFSKAMSKIAEAKTLFNDHAPFLPELIYMSLKGGDAAAFQGYVDECRKTQNEALWARCKIAFLDENQKAQLDKLSPEQRGQLDKAIERQHQEAGRQNSLKQFLDAFNKPQTQNQNQDQSQN